VTVNDAAAGLKIYLSAYSCTVYQPTLFLITFLSHYSGLTPPLLSTRFQTSRSGRLCLHTDIRLLISRRTDCDTAAAHAKGVLEAPNELVTDTMMPAEPRYSARQESASRI